MRASRDIREKIPPSRDPLYLATVTWWDIDDCKLLSVPTEELLLLLLRLLSLLQIGLE
jgi:hypothetical protein